ncbi:MAG: hypothetical protein DME23_26990 [Verrucomicrobia bacterium]|nr:MAG: hypothetical protein DME23_26990 [Verrucomicrobiota bacterium]
MPAVNINDRKLTISTIECRRLAFTPDYTRPGRLKKMTLAGTVYACALGLLFALFVMRSAMDSE